MMSFMTAIIITYELGYIIGTNTCTGCGTVICKLCLEEPVDCRLMIRIIVAINDGLFHDFQSKNGTFFQ